MAEQADIIDLTSPPSKVQPRRNSRIQRPSRRRRHDVGSRPDPQAVIFVDDQPLAHESVISLSSDEEEVIQTGPLDLSSEAPLDLRSPPARRRRRDEIRATYNSSSHDDVLVSVSTTSSRQASHNPPENDVIVVEKETSNHPPAPLRHGDEVDTDPFTPKRKLISCPVCMEHERTIRRTGRQLMSTVCGHIFCDHCIKQVMQTSKCCPTCRKKLTKKSGAHPIFL